MITIYPDTKIFVQCPAGACTGGAELLHQIVDYLRNKGKDAYIVYYGPKSKTIPNDYKKYNIEVASNVEDSNHNISVLYEPLFSQVADGSGTQKILWWLSVDNFYDSGAYFLPFIDLVKFDKKKAFQVLIRRFGKLIIKRQNDFRHTVSIKQLANSNALSCYQSEYAHYFLCNNGFKEMMPLKDYINTEHIKSLSKEGRDNIVLYNPKKGKAFTEKLMKLAPEIRWKPIINMTRSEVIEAMQTSKVYIDFGNHPGKDRLPRECAMNGLCVITGSRGSAGFFEDVWLENKYKFNEKRANKRDIIKRIKETIENYETAIDDFAFYRHRIALEQKEFECQLDELFGLK